MSSRSFAPIAAPSVCLFAPAATDRAYTKRMTSRNSNRRAEGIGSELVKTWLITGASRGFGRIWAEAALARGDAVAATARDVSALTDLADGQPADRLLALPLDVTDAASVGRAV